jgi:CheY-like chemotaxis protein
MQRWANSASEAAKRGATLTQRLLAYSRRQPLDPKPTDVMHLLNSMSDLLRSTLGENIEIQTTVEDGLWPAFVDVNQLDSAILNIAINARDAMDGRGQLGIDARNLALGLDRPRRGNIPDGDYVLISLSDTGKGIAEEVLDRVFEPFFTTKPIGQGTGLGLSQVYGFLKQTGGQIAIDSAPGEGTTVKMYLPRAAWDADALTAADALEAVNLENAIVILVVEDDNDVRAYTVETLTALGHAVREARNAQEALDILQQDPAISFLLTDVGLPGMNGNELARQALTMRPDVKTLFTSGYARQALMHHDRLDEGVHLLVKPFTREQLIQKIRAVLEQPPQRAAG